MAYKSLKKSGFTLIELLVAIGILVIVVSMSGVVFKASIDSHRTAMANAEIMQKFRAITNQLNSDFQGLIKDGEIFCVWKAVPLTNNENIDNDLDGYERFDRIMFFAEGDFECYVGEIGGEHAVSSRTVRGNLARICYTIAKHGTTGPEALDRNQRILARSQHILTDDSQLNENLDPNSFTPAQWFEWNNIEQYDKISLEEWKKLPIENKVDMLSVICDIEIFGAGSQSNINEDFRGISIEPDDANTPENPMHKLLCEGVGEFKIQGWDDTNQKWIPEVDPDGNGDLSDTHFFLNDTNNVPGILYPKPLGALAMNNISYPSNQIDREHFNMIPGLGRALKFTFTLYDSLSVIKEGRTFTHIIYLDN